MLCDQVSKNFKTITLEYFLSILYLTHMRLHDATVNHLQSNITNATLEQFHN